MGVFSFCCENIKICIDNTKIICEDIYVQRDKGDITNMYGTIELIREYNSNTSVYLTFGYYDSKKELLKAVSQLKEMDVIKKQRYYVRQDGGIVYYITLK